MKFNIVTTAGRVVIADPQNKISYAFDLWEAREFANDFSTALKILEFETKEQAKDLPITHRQAEELIEKKLAEWVVS